MKRQKPVSIQRICALLSCLLTLAACKGVGPMPSSPSSSSGAGSILSAPDGKDIDVTVEGNDFFDVSSVLKDGRFLCMQYDQGEPVQLWASGSAEENGESYASVYMFGKDGTRQTCIERIDPSLAWSISLKDSQNRYYSISGDTDNQKIALLDSAGQSQYLVSSGGHLWDLCELGDGRLALLTSEGNSTAAGYHLLLLDSEGKLTTVFRSQKFAARPCLGTSEDGLLLLEGDYVYRVSLVDGKREQCYSFRQTGYTAQNPYAWNDIQDFRISPDNSLEILRADQKGVGKCETLKLTARDKTRKDVVLRTTYVMEYEAWLKERILEFNNSQEEYRVVIDAYENGDDLDAFITATGMELAAGKGAEILMGSILTESVSGLIEKGWLVDLAPLMQQSGMKEEDYFPITFDLWRTGEHLYALYYDIDISERLMRTDVLQDLSSLSIEPLADAMLAYTEPAVYRRREATSVSKASGDSARAILTELLQGSETLWGMIDWETGACDFHGELFGKLLQAAKRYRYDERNNYPGITSQKYLTTVDTIYFNFSTRTEEEANGYTPAGILFDDGCHPVTSTAQSRFLSLMLNANSDNKDGAWEFVKFILSEDAQQKLAETGKLPVKRSAFETQMAKEIANGSSRDLNKPKAFDGPLTEERVDEIRSFLENARALPYKTAPILEIILDEAQDYFNDTKEIPQVTDIIENRVSLYLKSIL